MKTLERGQEKIKKICEVLREETLEPAKIEAQKVIDDAGKQAELIIQQAQKDAEKLLSEAKSQIAQEQNAFTSSTQQAAKQSIETLRQSIEEKFFNEHLSEIVAKGSSDPKLVAKLVDAIIEAIHKEGLDTDLTVLVPKAISAHEIAGFLTQESIKSIGEKGVAVGDFAGGAKVKLKDKNLTIDISDQALKDLLSGYIVRKDFRKLVFGG